MALEPCETRGRSPSQRRAILAKVCRRAADCGAPAIVNVGQARPGGLPMCYCRLLGGVMLLLSSVIGCSQGDNHSSPAVPGDAMPRATGTDSHVSLEHVSWDVSELESYFNIVSLPEFDAATNGFVMMIEARENGSCAVSPSTQSGFFGFEATLLDDDGHEIVVVRDIGSATRSAAPVEAYEKPSPRRIGVAPPRWSVGTKIRLTIAPGVERKALMTIRHGRISAI